MTSRNTRGRMVASAVATALAATSLLALSATPASAAQSNYANNTPTYAGTTSWPQDNSTAMTIPTSGPASVYPSEITVDQAAPITDVDVTLLGVSHTFAADIDVLLVGPGGQQVTLLSDAGGSSDFSNANLRFSDGGAAIPAVNPIPSGTYAPVDVGPGDAYPAPAPVNTSGTSLSVFNGTLAAGTWKLFVVDDLGGDSGGIAGGWRLTFDLDTTPYPGTLDVSGLPAISDVNVHVNGITTTAVGDINFLLVGPGGQQSYLMGDVSDEFADLDNASFTIDDEAPGPFPGIGVALVPGSSYRPALLGDIEVFPAPAPVASGSSPLTVFDGISPNGQWRLFALDDNPGSTGVFKFASWGLDFTWADTQPPTGTVTINGGASATNLTAVTLGVTANDPAPASGVTQMRFSNDGVTFSPYQAFAPTAAWTLATGDGVKTVYAQFKDGDGNQSAVATDTIALSTVVPDTTSPTVVKTTPKKNAKGVKVTIKVKLKVSEALNPSTVTSKTVYLKAKGSSKKVKAKLKYNAVGKTIVLTPKSPLKKGTKYTFTATTKVKDVAGNPLDGAKGKPGAQAVKFSFTTA